MLFLDGCAIGGCNSSNDSTWVLVVGIVVIVLVVGFLIYSLIKKHKK